MTVAMDTEPAGEEVVDIVAVVGNTAAEDTDTDNMENMVAAVEVDILQMDWLVQPLHYGLSAMKMSPPTATVTVT